MSAQRQVSEERQDGGERRDWVTVSSFFPPPGPEPAFEDIIAAERDRWTAAAKDAGLDPDAHIRISRGEDTVAIEISPALDAAFTPQQTLWKAV